MCDASYESFANQAVQSHEEWNNSLTLHPKLILDKDHYRLDGLIIKKPGSPPIPSPIAKIFRKYNAIDYKSPSESLNIISFYKALSYAYGLPDCLNDPTAVNQITLTLVSHHFPRKLVRFLEAQAPFSSSKVFEKVSNGIYYMCNSQLPIQLIVLPQLDPDEYPWISCLDKHIMDGTLDARS